MDKASTAAISSPWRQGRWKAAYRLAQSLYQKHDNCEGDDTNQAKIEKVWKFCDLAFQDSEQILGSAKTDVKLKEFR